MRLGQMQAILRLTWGRPSFFVLKAYKEFNDRNMLHIVQEASFLDRYMV